MRLNYRHLLLLVLGNLLLAIASAWLILPAKVISGGVNGIAIILEALFHWNSLIVINCMIALCFCVGSLVLGKGFALKTILSSLCYPLFLQLVSVIPVPACPQILASILGGTLTGIGIGFVMRAGGSSGGMDVPPLILHKFTGISISTWVLVCDALIVLGGLLVYGVIPVIIGIVSVMVCAKALSMTLAKE